MILYVILGSLVVVEIVVRLLFPRPQRKLDPQVRVKMDGAIGYRNRPNQKAFSMDKVATINNLGFRGPDIEETRRPNSLRVLGLGNSLTFGGGVGDDETYLAYLNQKLDLLSPGQFNEVMNAAIYGFTIRQYVPFLESVLPKLQPDIVLLGAHWRDLHFHPRFGQLQKKVDQETWQMMKKKFHESIVKRDFATSRKEILLKKFKDFMRGWRTLYVTNYYLLMLRDHITPPNFMLWQKAFLSGEETEPIRERRQESVKTLARMKQLCESNGAKFAMLVFPDSKQVKKSFPNALWPKLLIDVCGELSIPCLDLTETIKAAHRQFGRDFLVPYDVAHYSGHTHQVIAESLYGFLQENGFLKDQRVSKAAVA